VKEAVAFKKLVRCSETKGLKLSVIFLYKVRCKWEHHSEQSGGEEGVLLWLLLLADQCIMVLLPSFLRLSGLCTAAECGVSRRSTFFVVLQHWPFLAAVITLTTCVWETLINYIQNPQYFFVFMKCVLF